MKRRQLKEKAQLNGIWRIIPSPQLTEIFAQSSMDFQLLDCEHGVYDYSSLMADVTACQGKACAAFVRVSGKDNIEVQRCLDLGADGLVFPQLASTDDFTKAAAMMDHAPGGSRGFNPFVRTYGYGAAVKQDPLDRPWFIPIIEMLSAVEEIEDILQNDRIDLVYIGSYDLSAQLGCPGQMDHPSLLEVTETIIQACKAARVPVGMMALSPEKQRVLEEKGVTAVVHGVESHRILENFQSITGS